MVIGKYYCLTCGNYIHTYVMYNPYTDKIYLRKGLWKMNVNHECLGVL